MRASTAVACRRHRVALERALAHDELRAAPPWALVHLDDCDACRTALETSAAVIDALRRPPAGAEVPVTNGTVVRSRIERGRIDRWRGGIELAGGVLAVALSVAAFIPSARSGGASPLDEAGPARAGRTTAAVRDATAEAAWLRRNLVERKEAAADVPIPVIRPVQDVFGPEALSVVAPATPSTPLVVR